MSEFNFEQHEHIEEFRATKCERQELMEKALKLAKKVHEGQLRDEGTPYIEHVLRVAQRFDNDIVLKTIALLHDVLEDSEEYSYQDLKDLFGGFIADTVKILTKEKGYDMDEYMTKIASNYYALQVKLSDRIDNIKSLPNSPDPQKKSRYILETEKYFLNNSMITGQDSLVISNMIEELADKVKHVH